MRPVLRAPPDPAADPDRRRGLLLALLLVVVVALPIAAPVATAGPPAPAAAHPAAGPQVPRVPALRMPMPGPVVRGFDARAGPYGPGHRGIDLAGPVGGMVRAPAAGRVVFAGPVAGTTWVTLLVAPGVLVTLGPLLAPTVATGEVVEPAPDPGDAGGRRVRVLAPLGRLGPGHGGGSAGWAGRGATLHLSVRVDGVYVDPLAYLVDRPRPRLAPLPTPGGLPMA